VPSIITAIAMYYFAGKLGLIGNYLWLGLCHAVIAMPIVLLIVLSALHAVDPNLERAALGLGASRVRVFYRIVMPIVLPGVLSAALFAFLQSLTTDRHPKDRRERDAFYNFSRNVFHHGDLYCGD
jgi:ABC-type spermidine/putrescine transport system permease subunit II